MAGLLCGFCSDFKGVKPFTLFRVKEIRAADRGGVDF